MPPAGSQAFIRLFGNFRAHHATQVSVEKFQPRLIERVDRR